MNNNLKGGLGAAIAIVALISIVAVANPDDSGTVESTAVAATTDPTYIPYTPKYTTPTSKWNAPKKVDPYSTNGTWLVPSEIAPGTYRAITNDSIGGYYEVCATMGCDAFGDGELITNDFFEGSSIVVIPPNAVSIKLDDATLTPIQ